MSSFALAAFQQYFCITAVLFFSDISLMKFPDDFSILLAGATRWQWG
jgi:hypothetical protein